MVWLGACTHLHTPPVVLVVVVLVSVWTSHSYAQQPQEVLHFDPSASVKCVGGCSVTDPGIWVEGTPASFNNCVIVVEPTLPIKLYPIE